MNGLSPAPVIVREDSNGRGNDLVIGGKRLSLVCAKIRHAATFAGRLLPPDEHAEQAANDSVFRFSKGKSRQGGPPRLILQSETGFSSSSENAMGAMQKGAVILPQEHGAAADPR